MNCREFVDFLMSYLDGDLDPKTRSVFQAHLDACPACVAYMEDYEKVVEMSGCCCRDDDDPVPEGAPDELVRAILMARKAASS